MTIQLRIWDGFRRDDVARADALKNADWQKLSRMYYRLYNDGDKPNVMAMRRLARIVGLKYEGGGNHYAAQYQTEKVALALLDHVLKGA